MQFVSCSVRKFILLLSFVAASLCAAPAATKPNIVFILADDLGYTDLGCYGSKYYETPNLDRMAKQGIRFTDGHTTSPNCQPTRAALMSGQYMPRTGIYTVDEGEQGVRADALAAINRVDGDESHCEREPPSPTP